MKRSCRTILNILPYIILLISALTIIILKQNYMVDEIYSYGLSNHTDGIEIVFEEGKTYTPAVQPYLDYMSVKEGAGFDYANVWLNQTNDVHPPLYYAILHTVCSLFPGQFSRFFAGGINVIFVLLAMWALRSCLRSYTENDWIIFIFSVASALSVGILNNVSFFRMYVMAMCIVTMIYLVYLKKYRSYERGQTKEKPGFYLALGSLALCGALTHYYCVIFTVAVSAVFAVWQLFQRRFANVIGVVITGAVSGGAAYMIFPAMIDHVFHGYRGEQSMDNLKLSFTETLQRLKEFTINLDRELFGSLGLIVIGLGIVLFLAALLIQRKSKAAVKNRPVFPVILLWLSVFIYFVFVGKSAVYISNRYMFPVYALLILGVCLPLIIAADGLKQTPAVIVTALMVCTFTGMAYVKADWHYMYFETAPMLKTADEHKDADCLYIYDETWKTQPSFEEVSRYRSVTFISDDLSGLDELKLDPENGLAVLISSKKADVIKDVQKIFPQLTKIEDNGFYGYAESYYLYGN